MQTVFGLDFGTTNSALAVNAGAGTEVIDIDPHNPTTKTLRSVIFADEEQGVYVGQEAIVQYIEQGGAGRFMQSIKSFLTFKLINWHLIPQLRTNSVREALQGIKITADDPAAVTNLQNLIEDNNGFLLFQALEKAKIDLSTYEKSMIFFREQELEIREPVLRKEFEAAIHDQTTKMAACIDETMRKAGLAPGDIDVVFTTGGTSHIPCIRDLFVERFGREKMEHKDAFTSVAYGLGLSASMFF